MDDTDTVWVCPKGHRFRGRVTITIAEDTPCFEAMPYAGDFCSVCYFAFIATNIPRVKAEEVALESEP